MNFTPQQLAGGVAYGSGTRVGNWAEDIALEESKRAHFTAKKSTGSLAMQRRSAKLKAGNAPVQLTSNNDGEDVNFVYFGDEVCIDHGKGSE